MPLAFWRSLLMAAPPVLYALFLCVPQSIKPRCCPLFASLQGVTGCWAVMPFVSMAKLFDFLKVAMPKTKVTPAPCCEQLPAPILILRNSLSGTGGPSRGRLAPKKQNGRKKYCTRFVFQFLITILFLQLEFAPRKNV